LSQCGQGAGLIFCGRLLWTAPYYTSLFSPKPFYGESLKKCANAANSKSYEVHETYFCKLSSGTIDRRFKLT